MSTSIKHKISQLEQELLLTKKQFDKFKALTERQQIAYELHEKLCRSNHTDRCGWYYKDMLDPDNWKDRGMNYTVSRWLYIADAVIIANKEYDIPISKLLDILSLVNE